MLTIHQFLQFLQAKTGYTKLPQEATPTGRCNASELAMHVGCVDKRAVGVALNDSGTYAYVLLDDGTMVDGNWHCFPNGDWSVS